MPKRKKQTPCVRCGALCDPDDLDYISCGTCSLYCPSCIHEITVEDEDEEEIHDLIERQYDEYDSDPDAYLH